MPGADKAPETVSQLVMWRVAGGLEWATIANLSKGWANAHELTLARQFVEQLDELAEGDSGTMLYDVRASDAALEPLASEIGALLKLRPGRYAINPHVGWVGDLAKRQEAAKDVPPVRLVDPAE